MSLEHGIIGTRYIHGVHRHYYEFGKYRIATISNLLMLIKQLKYWASLIITIYGNTITNCVNGIGIRYWK